MTEPVAPFMSIDARGDAVGDVANRVEFIGNPKARREAVAAHATAQIRAAIEQDRNARDTLGGTHA